MRGKRGQGQQPSAAVSLRIKLHRGKSQLNEHQLHYVPLSAQDVHLTGSDLQTSRPAMVPDAQITLDAKPAEIFLTLFHLPQPLGSDLQAIKDSAGEAGCRWRIPDRNSQLLSSLTNPLFGPAEIQQRRPNLMLGAGTHARTMLSDIIGVGSVDDGVEAAFCLQPGKLSPELGLAVIAPISGIAQVSRILKLVGFELHDRYIETCGQPQGGIGLNRRIRGTPPNDRKKAIGAKNLAAYHRKQARINAS